MADRVIDNLIWQNPDRVSGAVCFYGTRLPVARLFEWLAEGKSVPEFCEHWELDKDMVNGVLRIAEQGLLHEFEAA
ncbi:MAG: DUF433 domain-containing protein [Fimbriimonadaceae bacterium]|nr:MAG: DUF433 domain-containing protein [Fimbriimonadaceae bacterium]